MFAAFQPLRRWVPLIAAILLGFIIFVAYGPVLSFQMTDVDTWPLIATSRIHNIHDVVHLFTHELMDGRMINARYYRPILGLSYGLDHAIWGVKPIGYHLHDLAIHWLNALLVVLLCRALLGSEQIWIALLAGLLFALHPIHIENVPAIARRADLLMTLFYSASLWALVLSWKKPRWFWLSLLFFALALLTKESAITLPAVSLALGLCFHPALQHQPLRRRLIQATQTLRRHFFGLLAVTLLYLMVRTAVLGGLGGYTVPQAFWLRLVTSLLGQPLGLFFAGTSSLWPSLIGGCKSLCLSLNHAMGPLLGTVLRVVFVSIAVILPAAFWKNISRPSTVPAAPALLMWCGIWILANATLLFVFGFNFRYLYLEIVPYSLALATALSHLPKLAWLAAAKGATKHVSLRIASALGIVALIAFLADEGFSWQHTQGLEHWKSDADLAQSLAQQLGNMIESHETGATYFLVNFPYQTIAHADVKILTVPLSVITLEHSLQAYADLFHPRSHARIVGLSYLYHYMGDHSDEVFARDSAVVDTVFDPAGTITVQVPSGGHPTALPWDETYGPHNRGRLYTVDKPERRQAVIHLTAEALAIHPKYFVIYDATPTLQLLEDPF